MPNFTLWRGWPSDAAAFRMGKDVKRGLRIDPVEDCDPQYSWLPIWISAVIPDTSVSINVVTLRQSRLVPESVTVCSLSHSSIGRRNEYPANDGGVNRHIT